MRFFTVILALTLVACATHPVSVHQTSLVPSSRMLAPQLVSRAQAQPTGSLIVKT